MSPAEPEPVRIGNRYRLDERIGAGAMGAVWRGTDELLNRPVAVKELIVANALTTGAPGSDSLEEARQRILREGRIGARLRHPHVISMFDVVVHDDRPWLVMEYLPSRSLAVVLADKGPMDPRETAAMGQQVADGLAAAHAAGVVHRDIKPGNILIADDGLVKITDFGVSRAVDDVQLTRTGMIAGTPAFLAPEIARGQGPTPASDIFALGATLYAAVEGEPPFGLDDNAYALLHKVATSQVRPPQNAGPITALLMRLLANEPGDRPSAAQAREALAAAAAGKTPSLPPMAGRRGTAILPFAAAPPSSAAAEPEREPEPAADAPVAKKTPTLTDLPPVVPDEGAAAPPPRPATQGSGRRNRWLPVLLVALALLVVGTGIVFGVLRESGNTPVTPVQGVADPPSTAAAPTTTGAAAPSSTATSTPSTAPTTTSTAATVEGAAAVSFVQQYYALLPGNTEAAWAMLGPQARAQSQGFDSFRSFYDGLSAVDVQNARSTGSGGVAATVVFTRQDGSTSSEAYSFKVGTGADGSQVIESFSRG